uniref:Uncharacterized protein n=1 Tax=Kalanchoe fedtschenkoi TaxID=63787 RepID=A0A7N0UF67_KALFE
MSVASYPSRQDFGLYKKPSIQRRNHSGELDVFEAANYFSASTINDKDRYSLNTPKPAKENSKEDESWIRPSSRSVHPTQAGRLGQEKAMKGKQPSSPGGRLASFFGSLFTNAKKKKSGRDDDDDLDQRHQRPRMRRSSIGHVDCSSRSMHTPRPIIHTTFDDSRSLQDHRRVAPTPDKPITKRVEIGRNGAKLIPLSDQNPKIGHGVSALEKNRRNNSTSGLFGKEMAGGEFEIKKDENISKGFDQFKKGGNCKTVGDCEFKRIMSSEDDDGDGFESDASSDLFELKLGDFSSGLPVYETTNFNVDRIKNSPKCPLVSSLQAAS